MTLKNNEETKKVREIELEDVYQYQMQTQNETKRCSEKRCKVDRIRGCVLISDLFAFIDPL